MNQPSNNNEKKPAAEKSKKADSKRSKVKDRKANTLLLIIILIFLTAIVAFGAIFMFDFAGLRAETSMWISNLPVVGKLMQPVIEKKNPEQIEREAIEREKANNAIKQKELNELEKELLSREKEIEVREKALTDKEMEISKLQEQLSEKLRSIQEQVQYLEKVDNQKAMQIIMNMNDKATAVQILRNMKKEKAAAILGLMDPLQAAQILEDLAD
ncbi:MAG TPA: hypothetical protein PLG67_10170 [Bacillota bacterium]|jgi:flagellar protein FlbB|nr:hypothetical protein [Bacillota bacterium]HQE65470.1 hypothetical protein [Bacillota bacterium]HQI16466.1 hypothetical protein [Bacillota bacterium]HQJ36878.1 hypothetical protein [Bacillota bacterium]HQL36944.1 hypothetical protein [Bacillota bacterium]